MEPEFLVNDFLESGHDELAQVVAVTSTDSRVLSRALFLREFVFGMSEAYQRASVKKVRVVPSRDSLEEKKKKLQQRIQELQKTQMTELPALSEIPQPHEV